VGDHVTRLATFVDAACAFAVTILVISVGNVPRSLTEFFEALWHIPGFIACLVLILLFWSAHNRFNRRYGLEDATTGIDDRRGRHSSDQSAFGLRTLGIRFRIELTPAECSESSAASEKCNEMLPPASANTDSSNSAPRATALARKALLAFVLTFIASRTVVFLIMSDRIPNLYFFLKGTHVHHLNYGIFLLAGVGAYLLFRAPQGSAANRAAYVYGIAMGLTFDEFGMWLHLDGNYWQRASVDAAIVVAALLGLIAFAPSWKNYESRHLWAAIAILVAIVVFAAVLFDAYLQIGHLVGPRLRQLELESSH